MSDQRHSRADTDSAETRTGDRELRQRFCDDNRGPESSLEDGVIFDVLRNDRRRATLKLLPEDTAVSVGLLAEQVAAIENDTTPERVTEQQRKRVYVSLHQNHLPKMDNLGIVAFDHSAASVSLGPVGDEMLRYVDGVPAASRAWDRYYGAIALGGTALLVTQVTLFPTVSSAWVTVAVLLAVAVCTALYWACDRR